MSDTRRDGLRERIEGELLAVYTIGYDREVADIVFYAKRIIGLVTAARDAEIRERLLSEEADEFQKGYSQRFADEKKYADRAVPEPDAAADATATDAVERVKAAIRGVLKSAWEDDDEKLIYPCDIDAMAHAAIAAVPTVQDTVGDDLDAMLDGVHPEATLSLHHISMPMADDPDPYWCAQVRIPITGFVGNRMYESTGATRREAVLNAVAKAKEAPQ